MSKTGARTPGLAVVIVALTLTAGPNKAKADDADCGDLRAALAELIGKNETNDALVADILRAQLELLSGTSAANMDANTLAAAQEVVSTMERYRPLDAELIATGIGAFQRMCPQDE